MFRVLPISMIGFMPVASATMCDGDHEMTGFFPRTGAHRVSANRVPFREKSLIGMVR
jgi:hypothetical protein